MSVLIDTTALIEPVIYTTVQIVQGLEFSGTDHGWFSLSPEVRELGGSRWPSGGPSLPSPVGGEEFTPVVRSLSEEESADPPGCC